MRKVKKWTEQEEKFIIENYEFLSMSELAKGLGRSYDQTNGKIAYMSEQGKLKRRPKSKASDKILTKYKDAYQNLRYEGIPELGGRYKIFHTNNKERVRTLEGEVISVADRHITLKTKNYRESFLKIDFISGEYKAYKIGGRHG